MNHTIISYKNGTIVEIDNNKFSIKRGDNYIELESYSNSNMVSVGSEIIVESFEDPITDLIVRGGFNSGPLILDNNCLYLKSVSINADTIFNNMNVGSKVDSISISDGKRFELTKNNLSTNKLELNTNSKIKFTHNGESYKFSNMILNNQATITNLYNFVETAKNFKSSDFENWSEEHNFHYLSSFIIQNQGCEGIPVLGNVIPPHDV